MVRVVRGIEEMPAQDVLASSSELGRRVVGPFWATTEQELMARLDRVTIEDLCRRAEDQGVASEVQRGFGARLLEKGLAGELGGTVTLDFRPEGLECRIEAGLGS